MTSTEIQLELTVAEADADAERLDELTRRLLCDLRELGAESVERSSSGTVPAGAKGEPFALGALDVVAVLAFLPELAGFLQDWSQREEGRRVRITTPAGLEVEFTPEKPLSPAELAEYVEVL